MNQSVGHFQPIYLHFLPLEVKLWKAPWRHSLCVAYTSELPHMGVGKHPWTSRYRTKWFCKSLWTLKKKVLWSEGLLTTKQPLAHILLHLHFAKGIKMQVALPVLWEHSAFSKHIWGSGWCPARSHSGDPWPRELGRVCRVTEEILPSGRSPGLGQLVSPVRGASQSVFV